MDEWMNEWMKGIFIRDGIFFIVIHLTMSHSLLNNNENTVSRKKMLAVRVSATSQQQKVWTSSLSCL